MNAAADNGKHQDMEKHLRYFIILTAIVLLLSGCGQTQTTVSPSATLMLPTQEISNTVAPTTIPPTKSATPLSPTQTPVPTATLTPKPLVICMQHPPALSPFITSQATHDVLTFISTYPVEQFRYQWEPRLLTHIPNFENGDVITRSVTVKKGASYTDSENIVQVYYGTEPLILTQMVVTYTLTSGLKWSDSNPLTAKDVAFGYSLAQNIQSFGFWQNLADRTAELIIIDDDHVRWEGLPGFISANYAGFLFPPQPEHVWHELTLSEILQDRTPPVIGPYRIADWEDDTSITLEPNPYYIGDDPEIDKVIILFPKAKTVFWPEMLRIGTCDILLPDSENSHNWSTWIRLVKEGNAIMWHSPSATLLRLDFNVMASNRRTAPLRSTRTRFGLANCVSRDHIRELPLGDIAEPAVSFIPSLHPAYDSSAIWRVPFNIEVGQGILDEIGWRDENGDGIREAHGIDGIRDNTPLTLTLSTSTQLTPVAEVIAADFRSCGVGIIIDAQGPQQLFAASSASPLYAGDFQLALYSWHSNIPEGCSSWASDHLPNDDLMESEYNYGGYINPLFDDACQQALDAVDIDQQIQALHIAQEIISNEQPTLFISWQPRWFISRPGISDLTPEISTLGRLYRPENITIKTK